MIWGMQSINYPDFAAKLLPFLQNFADRSHDRVTVSELIRRISEAEAQAWVCGDFQAVALTRVEGPNAFIDFCSGSDRTSWQDELEEQISSWARFNGLKRVIILCRPGWSKWAKSRQYREIHREFIRDL